MTYELFHVSICKGMLTVVCLHTIDNLAKKAKEQKEIFLSSLLLKHTFLFPILDKIR